MSQKELEADSEAENDHISERSADSEHDIEEDDDENKGSRNELENLGCSTNSEYVGKAAYTSEEYITLDKKLKAFRRRWSFRQFIPNKPAKYGLKIFALVNAKTVYILNQAVYVVKHPPGPFDFSNKPEDTIMRLCKPFAKFSRNITYKIPLTFLQTKNRPEKQGSSHHSDKINKCTGDERKPEIITFYNSTKGAVDVVDYLSSNIMTCSEIAADDR
ncbi:hypothetical protein ILUMI_04180 [Ignelater luminosus]|uniref:PiggyBac transposable element-derived protein domain-containing protein n=1 Tax=Ignelater luminosus TaxID=2038154 RepID=A0A8K0DKA4_IGNLU|nr:hypothetical protein ILUMI_04180 [Ignelater luminosus]